MLGVPSFPAVYSQQRQSSGRNKVALKPGRSLMDWVRYASSPKNDVQGFKGKIKPITTEELKNHCTVDDCWMAIKGHVFNVSAYMEYHPGGVDELMRGAGKDATSLFDEVHRWVNFQSMLAKCYIGPLKDPIKINKKTEPRKNKMSSDGFLIPTGPVSMKTSEVVPRYDWYEASGDVFLSIYTKNKIVSGRNVILDCSDGKSLDVKVLLGQKYYQVHLDLMSKISKAKVKHAEGYKIEILLQKENESESWKSLGDPLEKNNRLLKDNERELKFRDCLLKTKQQVSKDTSLYTFQLPTNVYYQVPIGHHVILKTQREGMEISRPYTVVSKSIDGKDISANEPEEELCLMIKTYENGAVTPEIDALQLGQSIPISDCTGNFEISSLSSTKNVWMIAAGTGFTPMIRIINHCLHESEEKRLVNLLFANKTIEDILWMNQLNDLMNDKPTSFHVSYILSEPDENWDGMTGRINADILKEFVSEKHVKDENKDLVPTIQSDSDSDYYLICGPDAFTRSIESILAEHGVNSNDIHCFLA